MRCLAVVRRWIGGRFGWAPGQELTDTRKYVVNVPNVILAFAGRVLLKQTKLQLEEAHR